MTRFCPIAALLLFTACTQTEPEPVAQSSALLTAQTVEAVTTIGQVAATLSVLTQQDGTSMPAIEDPAPRGDGPGAGEPAEPCTQIEWSILDPLRVTLRFADCPTASGETFHSKARKSGYKGGNFAPGRDPGTCEYRSPSPSARDLPRSR